MCTLRSLFVYFDLYVFTIISMCLLLSLCVYYYLYVYTTISMDLTIFFQCRHCETFVLKRVLVHLTSRTSDRAREGALDVVAVGNVGKWTSGVGTDYTERKRVRVKKRERKRCCVWAEIAQCRKNRSITVPSTAGLQVIWIDFDHNNEICHFLYRLKLLNLIQSKWRPAVQWYFPPRWAFFGMEEWMIERERERGRERERVLTEAECVNASREEMKEVVKDQCDQMAWLFFKYLTVYKNENLPNSTRNMQSCMFEILPNTLWTL